VLEVGSLEVGKVPGEEMEGALRFCAGGAPAGGETGAGFWGGKGELKRVNVGQEWHRMHG
jgi:hypothetical protein